MSSGIEMTTSMQDIHPRTARADSENEILRRGTAKKLDSMKGAFSCDAFVDSAKVSYPIMNFLFQLAFFRKFQKEGFFFMRMTHSG